MKKTLLISWSWLFLVLFPYTAALGGQKIVVVGAGLSGLTAAYRLKKAGKDVEVFEARKRVGGRVFSVQINGSVDEMGGKNIDDGGEALNIIHLAKELQLPIDYTPSRFASFFFDDKENKLHPFYPELVKNHPWLSDENQKKLKNLEKSSQNLGQVLDGYFGADSLLRRVYETRMKSYEGSEPSLLAPEYAHGSLRWMLKFTEANAFKLQNGQKPEGYGSRTIRGGNALIPLKLAEFLGDALHLQMPLKGIRKSASSQLELVFFDDSKVKADFVILTIPCTVLPKISIEDGIIPSQQWKEMTSIQHGTIAKILLPVKSEKPLFGTVLSDRGITWFNRNESVITFYYAGKDGVLRDQEEMNKRLSLDLKGVKAAYPSLRPLLGESIDTHVHEGPATFKVQSPKEVQLSEYTGPVGVSWAMEPYTLGGYSNFAPGQYQRLHHLVDSYGEKVIEMFRPVQGNLFFAGEHTALENPATMEGAVESGERVARMVLHRLKKTKPKVKTSAEAIP